jgi:type I restriction enzyme, S subunit
MIEDLPEQWIITTIDQVTINTLQRQPQQDESFVYIDIGSIDREQKQIVTPQKMLGQDAPSRARKVVQTGDVLVSTTRPNLNAVAMVAAELNNQVASTGFDVLRAPNIDPRWLFYIVRTTDFVQTMSELVQGALYPAIRSKDVRSFEIPIAPLNEQKRIADKLDRLLAKVDNCRERLDLSLLIFRKFRHSILTNAVSGKLSEDWRENNQYESASELIDKIKASRLLSVKRESDIHKISIFYENIIIPDRNKDSLPVSWVSCQIGAIGNVSNGSTPSRKNIEYWNGDIPWVSSGEVNNSLISQTKEKITRKGYENTSIHLLPINTVLIAMIGEGKTRGQTAILKTQACINQNIAAVVTNREYISSEYLWYWFQAKYEENRMAGSGTGPQALNSQKVRELPFNLPPIEEQKEIVRQIEKLFDFADRLEARYQTARAQIDKLTPALLDKAFKGELVPQDLTDEPAASLLAKIQSQKAPVKAAKTLKK